VIVINLSLFIYEQGVLSLCEEIDSKRLRNFFAIVYPLSVDLALSAQSLCTMPSFLALSAETPDWLAE